METLKLNLIAAWLGILLGFGSGLVLGLFFNREDWMGGYSSLKRRLYRLAHISFFGLGAVNLLFYFTALRLPGSSAVLAIASWAFIIGAISMPICCLLMAHFPGTHLLFGIPVASLLLGGILTFASLLQVAHGPASDSVLFHTLGTPPSGDGWSGRRAPVAPTSPSEHRAEAEALSKGASCVRHQYLFLNSQPLTVKFS